MTPLGRYERTANGFFAVAGFPTPAPISATSRVETDSLPAGPMARLLYRGDNAGVSDTYAAAQEWPAEHGYQEARQPRES